MSAEAVEAAEALEADWASQPLSIATVSISQIKALANLFIINSLSCYFFQSLQAH
jgi:hypothetical protein